MDYTGRAHELTVILQYFGILRSAMFMLMKSITGGVSWTETTDPLFPAGDVYVMPFAGFIPQPLLWQTQPHPWRI